MVTILIRPFIQAFVIYLLFKNLPLISSLGFFSLIIGVTVITEFAFRVSMVMGGLQIILISTVRPVVGG